MVTKKSENREVTLDIPKIVRGSLRIAVIGETPLIINRMSEKGRHEMVLPTKKTAATRAAVLKHEPYKEFQASTYRFMADTWPTYLAVPSTMFKQAMRNAALRIEGASKQLVGEMLYFPSDLIGIYGEPCIFMAVVRNSDINHTPDIRTRCLVRNWCAVLDIRFTRPWLNEQATINLLSHGGITQGIGDGRTNKGWGNFGSFNVLAEDDPQVRAIQQKWSREAQLKAMEDPVPYDLETEEMLEWFNAEIKRRGLPPSEARV